MRIATLLRPLPFLMAPAVLQAQPVLTSGQLALQPGDHFAYREFHSGIWPTTGANVVWDYASENGDLWGEQDALDPALVPGAALFPTATASLHQASLGEFQRSTSTDEEYLGYYVGPTDNGVCSDPRTDMIYPFSYGDSFTDSLSCFEDGPMPRTRSGTFTVTCAAYGTLILPMGTFTDCLLLHRQWSYVDDYGSPEPGTSVGETYSIVHSGYARPLLSYTTSTYTIGGGSIDNASGLLLTAVTTDAAETLGADAWVAAYPNPVTDRLTIELQLEGPADAVLLTSDGREVHRTHLPACQQRHAIAVDGCPAGTYLLQVHSAQVSTALRVIVVAR